MLRLAKNKDNVCTIIISTIDFIIFVVVITLITLRIIGNSLVGDGIAHNFTMGVNPLFLTCPFVTILLDTLLSLVPPFSESVICVLNALNAAESSRTSTAAEELTTWANASDLHPVSAATEESGLSMELWRRLIQLPELIILQVSP